MLPPPPGTICVRRNVPSSLQDADPSSARASGRSAGTCGPGRRAHALSPKCQERHVPPTAQRLLRLSLRPHRPHVAVLDSQADGQEPDSRVAPVSSVQSDQARGRGHHQRASGSETLQRQ